jgi:hypothetical protein
MLCFFVALGKPHAKRMRHVILSSLACLALKYLSTLLHKQSDFKEKIIEHKMSFDFPYFWPKYFSF